MASIVVQDSSYLGNSLNSQEIQYEEEIARNPYHLRSWINYLLYKKSAKPIYRYVLFERALKFLPRSFKLWKWYLKERRDNLDKRNITDKRYGILVNTFERALVQMHKMPTIW
jgi:pre-mRNA-splicing factor SYF1